MPDGKSERPRSIRPKLIAIAILAAIAGAMWFYSPPRTPAGRDRETIRTHLDGLDASNETERALAIVGIQAGLATPGGFVQAFSYLVKATGDESSVVRSVATQALGGLFLRFGSAGARTGEIEPPIKALVPDAVKAMTSRLSDPEPSIRAVAARGVKNLAEIGQLDKPPAELIARLDDESEEVREAAVESIVGFKSGPEALVPVALRRLPDEPGAAGQAFLRVFWNVRFEPSVLPLLTEGLSSEDPDVRLSCAAAINHMGPSARPALPAILDLLHRELKNSEGPGETLQSGFDTVAMAAGAIGQLAPENDPVPQAVELLSAVLMLEKDETTTREFDESGPPFGPRAGISDRRWELRRMQAAWSLGMLGPRARDAIPELLVIIEDDSSPDDRSPGFAAEALAEIARGTSEEEKVIEILSQAWPDAAGERQVAIGRALRRLGPDAVGRVPDLARQPPDPIATRIRRAEYPRF